MPVQIGMKASHFSDPTGLMSDCHRRIEMFLGALAAAAGFAGRELSPDEQRSLDAALRYFREAAPKHNADEEESLFPRLRSLPQDEVQAALADMARLEREHRWAEPLHRQIDRLGQQWLAAGRLAQDEARAFHSAVGQLQSMYRAHIEFEDKVLFPLAARLLPRAQQDQVALEMEARRKPAAAAGPASGLDRDGCVSSPSRLARLDGAE